MVSFATSITFLKFRQIWQRMPYKIVKASGDKVTMGKADFEKEHHHLIGILGRHPDPAMMREKRKQQRELKKVEKKMSGYFVKNVETGRTFSNEPMTLTAAKAQLRVLERHSKMEAK